MSAAIEILPISEQGEQSVPLSGVCAYFFLCRPVRRPASSFLCRRPKTGRDDRACGRFLFEDRSRYPYRREPGLLRDGGRLRQHAAAWTFRDAESHAATLAHELTHWTRHPSRLNREFGRKKRAMKAMRWKSSSPSWDRRFSVPTSASPPISARITQATSNPSSRS